MKLSQAIQKATLLADLRGDTAGAESVLLESLREHAELVPDRIRAQVFLGELLVTHNHEAAIAEFRAVVAAQLPPEWDDLVEDEVARARGFLVELDSSEE